MDDPLPDGGGDPSPDSGGEGSRVLGQPRLPGERLGQADRGILLDWLIRRSEARVVRIGDFLIIVLDDSFG